jgi:endonuclease YncB( thermonuclease family)
MMGFSRVVRKDKRVGGFLAAALLFIVSPVFAGEYLLLPIDKVYDGDTIVTHVHSRRLPPPLNELRVRIRGIDTAEMPAKSYPTSGKLGRAKCEQEAYTAYAARNAIVLLVEEADSKTMKLTNFEWGKYGGRIIADVKIDGHDLAEYLLAKGYAVRYDGKTKYHDWCK